MSLLEVSNLEVSFHIGDQVFRVIDRIDLTLSTGEAFVIVGESGCGKSAFAMSVVGILPSNARVRGAVRYRGQNLLGLDRESLRVVRGREIGFVPQSSSTCLNPVLTVETQLRHVLRQVPNSTQLATTVPRMLRDLGLEDRVARMYPHQLSEGMKGRVLVGLGVCLNPTLIVADEPTKGLDVRAKQGIVATFERIMSRRDRSLLMITHDFEVAAALPGRLGIMYAGEFVEWGPTGEILGQAPRHPYTVGLLRSLPERDFQPLPGRCAGLQERHRGCRFANRCSRAALLCLREHPALVPVSEGHWVRCYYA